MLAIALRSKTYWIVCVPISPMKLFVAVNQEQSIQNLAKRKPEEIVRHVNFFIATRARMPTDGPDPMFLNQAASSAKPCRMSVY